jgi:hypothetical protein
MIGEYRRHCQSGALAQTGIIHSPGALTRRFPTGQDSACILLFGMPEWPPSGRRRRLPNAAGACFGGPSAASIKNSGLKKPTGVWIT